MPPRLVLPPCRPRTAVSHRRLLPTTPAAVRAASTLAATPAPPIARHPPTQPPSHRAASARKTQLHRQYLSLLRSSPLLLLFQHNNLRATEWSAVRRELSIALQKVVPTTTTSDPVAASISLSILRGSVFQAAVRVAERFDALTVLEKQGGLAPKEAAKEAAQEERKRLEHGASEDAYRLTRKHRSPLAPLLCGPIGVLSFPAVSPPHLKAAVDLLFPANAKPKKGLDPLAASGLQKLILLAARVDADVASGKVGAGRVLDGTGVKWLAGLDGFEGLRGQLVAVLRNVGGGEIVRSLESIGTGVVRTVDARRGMMEEEAKGTEATAEAAA